MAELSNGEFEGLDEDEEEDTNLLEGNKTINDKGLFTSHWKILLSGIGVVVMVSLGVVIGASFSTRNDPGVGSDNPRCSDIRLPSNVIPLKYRIFLHPNITDNKFGFKGNVKILVKIKSATKFIILHSNKSLDIINTILHESENIELTDDVPTVKAKWQNCIIYEQLIIELEKEVPAGKTYVLHIEFSGKLATVLEGFYKSSYRTKGETRYLATTHFEATGARSAFPCFDEPAMKATFTIIIVREANHTALSNMPVEKTRTRPGGLVADFFQESVKMSTYLVAFVVCDFANISSTTKLHKIAVKVWAPKEQINQGKFALKTATAILDYYEEFFKVNFPLPKLDLIAIPDFSAGAMENWGLITYRLTSILYDELESSSSSKQWVATVVAHEFAHQWFGNLVTMKWWNDLWLNEGFASYVDYKGAAKVAPTWGMMDQFLLTYMQRSLSLDSHLNSHAISVKVNDPAQIHQLFDSISYNKGASIIRMMKDFIGADAFHTGLTNYLNKYKFGNAVSDDLWECMSKASGGEVNVKKVMETWTLQMGYPVINVIRKNEISAAVTQEHFITDVITETNKPKPSKFKYKWDVPLTYHFENDKETKRKWFNRDEPTMDLTWEKTSGWLKVNCDQIGFYRVNYDKENWEALAYQLEKNHEAFSDADRANLLDDAFELARADKIPHTQALDLTAYLKREKKYVPFVSAISSLGYIGGMLRGRPGYKSYEKYILKQVLPRVTELKWEDTGTHLDKYLRSLTLRSAVYHNDSNSVEIARGKFKKWMNKKVRIPPNLRSTVYLAGIKYGGKKEWDYMYDMYMDSQFPSEKKKLMYSLTSTSDPDILESYLKKALDDTVIKSQDSCSVIESVAGNPLGTKMAQQYVEDNWEIIHGRYAVGSFTMPRLIKSVLGVSKTQEGLEYAKKFISTHDLGSGKLAGEQSLAAIENHIKWLEKHEEIVVNWLDEHILESTSS